jgi:hypothetical protein
MMKKYVYLFALLISCKCAQSQYVIKGRVMSAETQKPLPSVSVYLNNTSIGTTSDQEGIFTISGIPKGKFRLVASSIGYETYVSLIDPHEPATELIISLKPKAEELKGFVVVPFEPNGWEKWGKLFTEIFIGTTPNSNDCHLTNPEIIKFRLNANNTLTAFANKPLHIVNDALGYVIDYKLEEFEYNLNTKVITYNGYALFTDLARTHPKKARKYEEERRDDYTGSLMHFMRAYFINHLESEGFEMRSLAMISNPRKDYAKKIFSQHKDSIIIDTLVTVEEIPSGNPNIPPMFKTNLQMQDSTNYFRSILLQPDSLISRQLISADSVGFAADSSTAGLYFPDSLEVSYKWKDIPNKYKALTKQHKLETYPVSQFVFVNKRPVFVLSNGYYYGPYDLKITGYWAWWETMSTMLPYDYVPEKK